MSIFSNKLPQVKQVGAGSTFDKAAYNAYETVKAERDALKESEAIYKKKVVTLEEDAENLLKSYQGIYAENKVLRGKVEHGPDAARIRNFRSEIKRLEDKVTSMRSDNSLLKDEVYRVQKQLNIATEDKKRIEDAYKVEREIQHDKKTRIEKENKDLGEKVDKLEKKCQEYEHRIKNYEEESDGLVNRYKELKRENLKMEMKFKKQKDLGDDELRDMKDANKEMAKEIILLKTKLARTQSDYESTKLDYEAAKKQIDYQFKELDVFKTQSTVLKRNVKVSNRDYNNLKEELKSAEDMLEDARSFGFEAVFEERKSLKRKENIHLKRIDDLEMQIEELSRENGALERDLGESKKKIEAALLEQQNLYFEKTSMKRRLEVIENANIELDRRTKFMHDTGRKGVVVTMPDENLKAISRERNNLLANVRFLETQNRRLMRKVRELEHGEAIDDNDIELTTFRVRSTQPRKDNIIRAEMPSLGATDYKTSYRKPRSFPSK